MSSNPYKDWFFAKSAKQYADVSEMFAGLGTVLIDGDALLMKLFETDNPLEIAQLIEEASDEKTEAYQNKLKKFINKFNKSGLDSISIFFLHCYSNYTIADENNNMSLINGLENIIKNFKCNIFLNFGQTWHEFISTGHISFIITSHLNIYKSSEDHFAFIYNTCREKKLQVCLIDYLNFRNLGIFSFLIFNSKDERDVANSVPEIIRKLPQTNEISTQNEFKYFKLENNELAELFKDCEFNNMKLAELNTTYNFNYYQEVWETKIEVRFEAERRKRPDYKNRQAQMYYRYMEKYSLSLNSSQNLHHKIIAPAQNSKQAAGEKWSQNALKQLEEIEKKKMKKDEEKDMDIYKMLEDSAKTIEELDLKMKNMDIADYTAKFRYKILKLKIKFYKYETRTNPVKAMLCVLIKETIENYCEFLSAEDLKEYLELIKIMGFESTAAYFRKVITDNHKKLATSANLDKMQFSDTTKNDILFQLTYLGDKLKRTLNSKPDKRVRFEPDDWQKELLDAVDSKQSALVCCPTSGGKTLKKAL